MVRLTVLALRREVEDKNLKTFLFILKAFLRYPIT